MTILILTCVTAFATVVYGLATLLLWYESKQDRKLREKQFHEELTARKLDSLHSAYYEAWGFWVGNNHRGGTVPVDASQAGSIFEALIRLEGQLRLNGYKKEANNLGISIRTLEDVEKALAAAGIALGLTPSEYRRERSPSLTERPAS